MIRKLYEYYYRKQHPIQYAKKIGVNIGKNCRLIDVSFSSEPYLITLGDHVSATSVRFETHDGGVWVFREEYPEIDKVKTDNSRQQCFSRLQIDYFTRRYNW